MFLDFKTAKGKTVLISDESTPCLQVRLHDCNGCVVNMRKELIYLPAITCRGHGFISRRLSTPAFFGNGDDAQKSSNFGVTGETILQQVHDEPK